MKDVHGKYRGECSKCFAFCFEYNVQTFMNMDEFKEEIKSEEVIRVMGDKHMQCMQVQGRRP
jgi:hypothetical protein